MKNIPSFVMINASRLNAYPFMNRAFLKKEGKIPIERYSLFLIAIRIINAIFLDRFAKIYPDQDLIKFISYFGIELH